MYIEKVHLGVPVSREVVLHNQSLLTAQFEWKEVRASFSRSKSKLGMFYLHVRNVTLSSRLLNLCQGL